MFTIVINEKGGTERREAFDGGEISVGRVQGNDLMLPKGNVSKHHARLLLRDARFIVTDLRSTNGTYVNGRKISQATLVREGDKIYIGDFVLRLEASGKESGRPAEAPAARTSALDPGSSPAVGPSTPLMSAAPAGLVAQAGAAPPPEPQNVSHFPLERDPDSESAPELRGMPLPMLPAPPRLPQRVEPRPRSVTAAPGSGAPQRQSLPASQLAARPTAPAPGRSPPREGPQQAARRLALITLVDRVTDEIDLASVDQASEVSEEQLEQIERAVRDQAKAMRVEGEAPEGVDLETLSRDAIRELVDVGPLGPLLDDDSVTQIHVWRPDYVLATRNGQSFLAEPGFTSEPVVRRAIARLAGRAGEPLRVGEPIVDRRLPRGARMVAVGPPVAQSWVLAIRKPRRFEVTFDELVRSGALSRPMAVFLEACATARANILVIGSGPSLIAPMLGALAAATPIGERVAMFQDEEDIAVGPHAHRIPLRPREGSDAARTLLAATRLGAGRVSLGSLTGELAAATIDAIAEGFEGVFGGVAAPSMRQGLARLAAQIALARPGTSIEVAREAVGESFDVAVEMGRSPTDQRLRVLRISELIGSDAKGIGVADLFISNAEAVGEPTFVVTGNTPRFTGDFAARGVTLDAALFKRAR
ncbi:MAG: FHA domain-containing protein [Polyangiaceae bacterium]|jgi:pilus assembly protein CpaF